MEVSAVDGDLLLQMILVGNPPEQIDPLYTIVGYYFLLDVDGDSQIDFYVDISSTEDWAATLFRVDDASAQSGAAFPGSAATLDEIVLIRVELAELGFPPLIGIRGLIQYEDYPDPVGDPFTSSTAEDLIPNNEDKWLVIHSE